MKEGKFEREIVWGIDRARENKGGERGRQETTVDGARKVDE